MHLIIKRSSWSSNDWSDTRYSDDPDQAVPLKLGVVEEAPRFKIAEIGPDWARVLYSESVSASHGTFDKECNSAASGAISYYKDQVIKVGERVSVSYSDHFSESAYGGSTDLVLSDKMVEARGWDAIKLSMRESNEGPVTIQRRYIEVGKPLRQSYLEQTGKDVEWLDFAPIKIADDSVTFKDQYGRQRELNYQDILDVKAAPKRLDLFLKQDNVTLSLSDDKNKFMVLTLNANMWENRTDPDARVRLADEIKAQYPDFDPAKILD